MVTKPNGTSGKIAVRPGLSGSCGSVFLEAAGIQSPKDD
jgi:hypothetical protein